MDNKSTPQNVEKASVWIIDDNDPFCFVLAKVINKSERLCCDKYFTSAKAALHALDSSQIHPKVVLLDISMPVLSGLDAIRMIDQASPGIIIIMLTSMNEEDALRLALKRGARGYILKVSKDEDILRAIESSLDGGRPLDALVTHNIIQSFTGQIEKTDIEELSTREYEVLKYATQGLKSREIGKILNISHYTVETHLRNIFNKLKVTNRVAMVAKASKEGLV